MEIVIGNHQDRCRLIHEITSAPVGSIVVIIPKQIVLAGAASSSAGNKVAAITN